MRQRSGVHKAKYFLSVLYACCLCISGYDSKAQLSYRVLFLGNSYTAFNNLPQMIHDVALSVGDTLIFDSHTPGGYQLADHVADIASKNKIMAGGWDYVVIQGQSQEPVTLSSQFSTGGFALYNLIRQYNSCAITMPYMTWGRKNGDQSNCAAFPLMCTYQGMDNALKSRYVDLTALINGEVSPVSVVWKYLRQNYPGIDLYQADESHPSTAGSYAAACCFYTSLFKKDPTLVTFNAGLSSADAAIIRSAAKTQVFDSLQVWDFKKLPTSKFSYQIGPGFNEVIFQPVNQGTQQTYFWDFGDGASSSSVMPTHTYAANGTFTVSLLTTNCDLQGLHSSLSDTVIQFCSHTPTVYTSHAWLCNYDTLWTQPADSYQWLVSGVPVPETSRYLADYARYTSFDFSVISKLNGCSELSRAFTETPAWTGYYFDALGDPCVGDTVAFAVLHGSGLSGSEKIFWYKDEVLLPSASDGDTLLISGPGKYQCKIIDPNSDCPFDTTSHAIEFKCGTVGINKKTSGGSFWSLFPNPASENITIKLANTLKEQVHIYNAVGGLVKNMEVSGSAILDISDLPNGLYFARLKSSKQPALKFMKE